MRNHNNQLCESANTRIQIALKNRKNRAKQFDTDSKRKISSDIENLHDNLLAALSHNRVFLARSSQSDRGLLSEIKRSIEKLIRNNPGFIKRRSDD